MMVEYVTALFLTTGESLGLLLERHTGNGEERRHDGRVAVDRPDRRWCLDGFEIGCENGERERIAFTLDCCDREAIAWVATTGGIDIGDIRDLMVVSVERRFGPANRLPLAIEWLSDDGSPYTARETRALARDIGFVPRTTLIAERVLGGLLHQPSSELARRAVAQRLVRMHGIGSARTAVHRPHDGTMAADAIGSSPPAARGAETRRVWLDASAAADQS